MLLLLRKYPEPQKDRLRIRLESAGKGTIMHNGIANQLASTIMFKFGIEHEVALINAKGQLADFSRAKFSELAQIIERLPSYESDGNQLHIGDAGIRQKRWYLEGMERFSNTGELTAFIPKGIEIRTTIHSTVKSTIAELQASFHLLREAASNLGFSPALATFNPYLTTFDLDSPLSEYEIKWLEAFPEDQTDHIAMLSYGPDLNLSLTGMSFEEVIDAGQKLIYYSPYIIPFSYSSPFFNGSLWDGLSVRTFIRTGLRSTVRVFLEKPEQQIYSQPVSTKVARLPAEVGRIEFKAFDGCDDFTMYASLLALLKGIILDKSLLGRSTLPDVALHQISARFGFDNEAIFDNANQVLQAAQSALNDHADPDSELLRQLFTRLKQRRTRSHELIESFHRLGSIKEVLQDTYQFSGLDSIA